MPYTFRSATFGNNTGGSSADPSIPTLTFSDAGNGTGGTATIAGSDVGTTNTIYVSLISSPLSFASAGSRSGNGTVTLSLGAGTYIGYVVSTSGAFSSRSLPIEFTVTGVAVPSATGGAPSLATLNSFQPICCAKVPSGDLVIVNGLDRGLYWDGCYNYPTPTAFQLGIDAPAVAPSVTLIGSAGAATAGAYNCYYRYVDFQGRYSSLSPVTVVSAANSDEFSWAFNVSGQATRIVSIELWRTTSGGANRVYRIHQTNDNTTTTYSDTLSDATLLNNALLDPTSTMLLVNDDGTFDALRFNPPPNNKLACAWFQNRMFYCGDVSYDQGTADVTNGQTGVVGVGTNWPTTFIGRYFYGSNTPRGYLIDAISAGVNIQMTVTGGPAADCVQRVTLPSGVAGGTFTITLDGHTTGNIAYNASSATVQTALQGLVNIGSGNVSVAGSAGGPFTCTFQGALANTSVNAMTGDGSLLSGIPATVTELIKGSAGGGGGGAGTNENQLVGFKTVDSGGSIVAGIQSGDGGQFQLSFNGHSTPAIAVHPNPGVPNGGPSAASIQALLEALPSIGSGNVLVTDVGSLQQFYGNGQMQWQLTFQNALGSENVPQATIDVQPNSQSTGVKDICFNTCAVQAIQATLNDGSPSSGGSAGAINEVQQIVLPTGTSGGTFTITFNATTTGTIAWNASAATVQAALVAALGANFSVSGNAGGPWTVTFTNTYGGTDVAMMTVNTTSLLGGSVVVTIQVTGGPGANCVQTFYLGSPTAGTYTLTFSGHTTAALAYNASASTIQTALQGLVSIGSGNLVVAVGSEPGTFTFTFQGALADTAEPLITADLSGVTGAVSVSNLTLHEAYGGATAAAIAYVIRPAPVERNQFYYSEEGEPESVPSTNVLHLQQFGGRDDEVVGCFVHGPYLYFMQTAHLIYFDYSFDPKQDGSANPLVSRGAFNNRCVDVVDDSAFLMDREGPYAVDVGGASGGVRPLGDAIQDKWRSGDIDFSKASKFFVKCNPTENTARYFYCTSSDSYPRQALCYNYKLDSWWTESYHEEMGAATLYPLSGAQRVLLGGKGGLVHATSQGNADGIDSSTESGTIAGTVTGSGANTLTDSTATFTSTMPGAPVLIVAGTAKGAIGYIQSISGGTELILSANWSTQPAVGDSYVIGAIPWEYRTGMLSMAINPQAGDQEMPRDQARAARISWLPTANPCTFDIRRYLNNDALPQEDAIENDMGNGLTSNAHESGVTQEMWKDRAKVDQSSVGAIGFTRYEFDHPSEDYSEVDRWISILLSGFQSQDKVAIYSVEVDGASRE